MPTRLTAQLQRHLSLLQFAALPALFMLATPSNGEALTLNAIDRADFANLVYDANSGSVVLNASDTESGEIISFTLRRQSDADPLLPDAASFPFADTGRNTDASAIQIGQFQEEFSASGFETHLLGSVFPPGMSLSELTGYLEVAIYASDLGQGGNFDAMLLTNLTEGDFDGDGALTVSDIDSLSAAIQGGTTDASLDFDGNGVVGGGDRVFWVEVVANTYFGDTNLDGVFDTNDLIVVFQSGEFEDGIPGNSTWSGGDWNGDGDFGTADFIAAFASGGFERGPRAALVPELSSTIPLVLSLGAFFVASRRIAAASW